VIEVAVVGVVAPVPVVVVVRRALIFCKNWRMKCASL